MLKVDQEMIQRHDLEGGGGGGTGHVGMSDVGVLQKGLAYKRN